MMFDELREIAQEQCPERRVQLLRKVSDAYFRPGENNRHDAEKYLLGEIIDRIVSSITTQQKMLLGENCDIHPTLARRLAEDSDIAVAEPVLRGSALLTEDDLVSIGRIGSPGHLMAIAGRPEVSEAVSDTLIERDQKGVDHALTANAGARFSSAGMDRLIEKASADLDLCTLLVDRPDLTQATVDRLLPLASAALMVRMAERGFTVDGPLPPDFTRELRRRFSAALRQRRSNVHSTVELVEAVAAGKLGIDEAVWTLVTEERLLDVATLVGEAVSFERTYLFGLIAQEKLPPLLIVFRAAGLAWHTAEGVVRLIGRKHGTRPDLDRLKAEYEAIDGAVAQRTLRFFKARRLAGAAA